MTGTIVRMVRDRGFAFVREETTGAEHFFHAKSCDATTPYDTMRIGDRVTFSLRPVNGRLQAVEVKVKAVVARHAVPILDVEHDEDPAA